MHLGKTLKMILRSKSRYWRLQMLYKQR